jgi:hypothetical protein
MDRSCRRLKQAQLARLAQLAQLMAQSTERHQQAWMDHS